MRQSALRESDSFNRNHHIDLESLRNDLDSLQSWFHQFGGSNQHPTPNANTALPSNTAKLSGSAPFDALMSVNIGKCTKAVFWLIVDAAGWRVLLSE